VIGGRTISVCPILKSYSSAKPAARQAPISGRTSIGTKASFKLTRLPPHHPRTVAHQARRAGRRSHTAGSGGLRQASRSFISSSSSRSHLRTASIRSTSVGAAGRLFDCHAISATSLRLSTGSPLFQVGGRATWQNRLNRSLLSQIAPLVRRAAKRGHKKPRPERGQRTGGEVPRQALSTHQQSRSGRRVRSSGKN
jgi:hypothetical protein